MAEDSQLIFRRTCEVFELRTCRNVTILNQRFMDPCDCQNYYQCSNNYEMLHQTCAEGTAWDSEKCIHSEDVFFNQNCSPSNVWTRCNVTESRLLELQSICTNSTTTTPTVTPSSQRTPSSDSKVSGNTSPGVIVGSIIGGAVIAVIILIAAFCLYKRRKQKNSIDKKRGGTNAHNPEYFEGGHLDDPYAVINDAHVTHDAQMSDPTYNGSALGLGGTMSQQSGVFTNAGFDETAEETVYDNSRAPVVRDGYTSTLRRSALGGTMSQQSGIFTNAGFDGTAEETVYDNSRAPVVRDGYTSTLRRSDREYETPFRAQSSNEYIEFGGIQTDEMSDNRTDLNGNQAKMLEHATAASGTNVDNTENSPHDYYTLTEEDHKL
ncbi:uncharacterized protein LOC132749568 isoform X1 [Ruditapes philippinarum]|uniref:uncharacterized protein LOC132749568 isoform X1 n=1 Tax=Ruditapes philippinarum TaxID=129788 RepID=UPI00295C0961|nr:uncharacterized protein LOC132749568 isoform X1 [Ruditapes philippinarum]XP_060595363.1 uncharacterized protein LOC132749568 isoform X1 [Ruditapes philippinarum]